VESVEEWLTFSSAKPLGSDGPFDIGPFGEIALDTDGKGRWICVVGQCPGTLMDEEEEKDLYIYRSDDNGETWTSEELLHPEFAADDQSDNFPKLATDGTGNWVVVWLTQREGVQRGKYGGTRIVYVSRSDDNGNTWSTPCRLNPAYDEVGMDEEEMPLLATDGDGTWICATLNLDFSQDSRWGRALQNSQVSVFTSKDAGRTWSEPQAIYKSPAQGRVSAYDLSLAQSGGGQFALLWTEAVPSPQDEFARRAVTVFSKDGGQTWSDVSVMSASHGLDLRLGAGTGKAHVAVWQNGQWDTKGQWRNEGLVSARSKNLGRTWSPITTIHRSGADGVSLSGGDLSTDGYQHWLGVWQGFHDTDRDMNIYGSVSLDDGRRWSPIMALNPNTDSDRPWGYEMAPTVATDGNGRWIVVWQSGDASGFRLFYRVCDVVD
jgi:Neuraminidase (sialidase)